MSVHLIDEFLSDVNRNLLWNYDDSYTIFLLVTCFSIIVYYMLNNVSRKLITLTCWNIFLSINGKYLFSPNLFNGFLKSITHCVIITTSFIVLLNFTKGFGLKASHKSQDYEKSEEYTTNIKSSSTCYKYFLLFPIFLTLLVLFYPNEWTKSGKISIFHFDHIHLSLIITGSITYLISFHQLVSTLNKSKISKILIEFGGVYIWLLLIGSLVFMIQIGDLLEIISIHPSSSYVSTWFIMTSNESFTLSFITFYLSMINCWNVLIFLCFSLFPACIWLV